MSFQHRLGSEDPKAAAQVLDRLSSHAFQMDSEESERELLDTRNPQGFVQHSFDDGTLMA
ncbi:MAG: hypothetical protein U0670_14185 [Anaerolineae bacterium]